MRFEHLWRVHFLITELGLAQNFRLQLKLHKFFNAFTLNQHLWSFFVNRDTEFVFLSKEQRVVLRREFKPELIQERT